MKTLPLYPAVPRLSIEDERPVEVTASCQLCPLAKRERPARTRCMAGEGEEGGLLVISDYPGAKEDSLGRPFVGETGQYLRRTLSALWDGPIAFDNAVKCAPFSGSVPEASILACRRYLAQTLKEAQPRKVLLMGGTAIQSFTGRSPAVFSVRHGYTWLSNNVPVWLMPNPVVALRNRFHRQWFEDDLRHAIRVVPPIMPQWRATMNLVESYNDAELAYEELSTAEWVAFDTETAGKLWSGAFQILCVACCSASGDVWVWGDKAMRDTGAVKTLKVMMHDQAVRKIGQNVKYDQAALLCGCGITVNGVVGDTRLLRKMLDGDAAGDLETMAELVGMGGHKGEAQAALDAACKTVRRIARANSTGQRMLGIDEPYGLLHPDVAAAIALGVELEAYAYGFIPADILERYCGRDALTTARLYRLLEQWARQDEPNIRRIYSTVLMPASEAIHWIERWGMAVSRDAVSNLQAYLGVRLAEIMARIKVHGNVNPASVKELRDFLYGKLGLQPGQVTDKGTPSTDSESLEALRGQHPVVDDLLEWRRLSKLDGTYASGIGKHIRPDGRVHPSFFLDGARSGRMSSTDPNLQNIPRDADSIEGRMIRQCFSPPLGHVLVSIDYSQLELRVAAMLSGDEEMTAVFKRGEDLHLRTAQLIAPIVWGIAPSAVQKSHRTAAKAFTFGLLYGAGDPSIAERAGCSVREATKIREAVLGKYRKLAQWIEERLAETRKTGYSWTWWAGGPGRRRTMASIADQDEAVRGTYERSSWNTPIQGTGSEFLTASLSGVVSWILDNGIPAKVCVPIHDSLVLEVQEDAVTEVIREVSRIMTSWDSHGVPLVVDAEVGPTWGDMAKWTDSKAPAQV